MLGHLTRISGLDEVSFHMSGTEAVMCAVRLARFNTRKPLIVQFQGAYHGWWDGVQTGVGNERQVADSLTLLDMSPPRPNPTPHPHPNPNRNPSPRPKPKPNPNQVAALPRVHPSEAARDRGRPRLAAARPQPGIAAA